MTRLSDTQYKLFVRSGIFIVVIAALAFDKVPIGYQPLTLGLALIGAAVGFFPFATSRPFESVAIDNSARHDSGIEVPTIAVPVKAELAATRSKRDIILAESVMRDLQRHSRQKELGEYYYVQLLRAYPRSYLATLAQNLDERQARVKEVHDLIDKLKGTPKKFSVQLTSDNTIIVHCESEQPTLRRVTEVGTETYATVANEVSKEQYVN